MKISFQNIQVEEKIAFQNVISQRKQVHYKKMDGAFQKFISIVVASGYHLKGPYFYSLNNAPIDEIVDIEMFIPIFENCFDTKNLATFNYHTYFEVGPVLKNSVTESFEKNTEQVYAELLATLEINDLEINTPFFHILPRDKAKYTYIYLGYTSNSLFLKDTEGERE